MCLHTDPIDDNDIPELDMSDLRPARHFERAARRQLVEIERLALELQAPFNGAKTPDALNALRLSIEALRQAVRSALEAFDEVEPP